MDRCLLGVGALVLRSMDRKQTMTALWDRLREVPEVGTFTRFVLALDLLYALGAVELEDGLLRRADR